MVVSFYLRGTNRVAELKKRFRDFFLCWESLFASAVEFGCFCLIDGRFVGMGAIAAEWFTLTAAGRAGCSLASRCLVACDEHE